jgi:thiamine pyrophosphate-dependent acetolactate synthase large subunit-like protein
MSETVADHVLARLREWGVDTVFGYAGDGINGLLAAWDRALAADRPTVLDVHCDANFPPIPPHATIEQMKDAALSLLKGDSDRWEVLKQGIKTKAQEFLPHRNN